MSTSSKPPSHTGSLYPGSGSQRIHASRRTPFSRPPAPFLLPVGTEKGEKHVRSVPNIIDILCEDEICIVGRHYRRIGIIILIIILLPRCCLYPRNISEHEAKERIIEDRKNKGTASTVCLSF